MLLFPLHLHTTITPQPKFLQVTPAEETQHWMSAACIAQHLPNSTYLISLSLSTPYVHHLPPLALELPENTKTAKETFTQESTVLNAFFGGRISKQFCYHHPRMAGGRDCYVNWYLIWLHRGSKLTVSSLPYTLGLICYSAVISGSRETSSNLRIHSFGCKQLLTNIRVIKNLPKAWDLGNAFDICSDYGCSHPDSLCHRC